MMLLVGFELLVKQNKHRLWEFMEKAKEDFAIFTIKQENMGVLIDN